jgi:hypothetical protein
MTEPILIETFGDAVNLRVLNFFIENPFEAYTVAEISRFAGVSRNSVYKYLPLFLERRYLTESNGGGRTRYRLNRSNRIVKHIDDFVESTGDVIVGPVQVPAGRTGAVLRIEPPVTWTGMQAAMSA